MITRAETTIFKPMSNSYKQLCDVKYAFSTATYRSVMEAQYLLREPIDPMIFLNCINVYCKSI